MLDKSLVVEIELELTGWCNLSCPMCSFNFLSKDDRPKKQPDILEIINFLNDFSGLKVVSLIGEYSEPLAYKNIFELINYLNSRDITIKISTNGSLFTENWWKKLSQILKSKDKVTFAIDGHTKELHEKYRIKSDLNKVVKNIRSFIDVNKKHDAVQTINFEYNTNFLEEIKLFVKNIGASEHIIVDCKPHLNKKIHNKGYIKPFNEVQIGPPNLTKRKQDIVLKKMISVIENKTIEKNFKIECISKKTNRIYVTNNLEILPCCEFAKLYKSDREWDQNYETIESFKHNCCAVCEKSVRHLSDNLLGKNYFM